MVGTSRKNTSLIGWDRFGARLKEMELKNKDAAKKMGVSEEMVRQYKNQGVVPSAEVIYKLSASTNKSMEWWLTGVERPIQIDQVRLSQEFYLQYPFLRKAAQQIMDAFKEGDHHMIVKQFEYAAERIKNFHETSEPRPSKPSRKHSRAPFSE